MVGQLGPGLEREIPACSLHSTCACAGSHASRCAGLAVGGGVMVLNSIGRNSRTVSDLVSEPSQIPVVSVLMPVRNGLPYLECQLAALEKQSTSLPWELIVSDNGSTDGSAAILDAWATRLPLHVINSEAALGRGGALSVAANMARGKYLLFCDADDVADRGWIAALAAALTENECAGGHLEESRLNSPLQAGWRPAATPGHLPRPLGLLISPMGANCGVRADAYERVGGFDPAFTGAAEEVDLFWRLQRTGSTCVYVPDAVMHYRHRQQLRDLLRQWRMYGKARPQLAAKHADLGLVPESRVDLVRTLCWFGLRSVDLFRSSTRRVQYLRMLAHLVGQMEGSRTQHWRQVRSMPRRRRVIGSRG